MGVLGVRCFGDAFGAVPNTTNSAVTPDHPQGEGEKGCDVWSMGLGLSVVRGSGDGFGAVRESSTLPEASLLLQLCWGCGVRCMGFGLFGESDTRVFGLGVWVLGFRVWGLGFGV